MIMASEARNYNHYKHKCCEIPRDLVDRFWWRHVVNEVQLENHDSRGNLDGNIYNLCWKIDDAPH